LCDHYGSFQRSRLEAEIAAQLAGRLMVRYGLSADHLALVSPHRAHNNAVAARLRELPGMNSRTLPLIDTIERVQGAERDVVLFAFTTSDPDYVASEFINNPNRFNVAITRARKKLIVIGSPAFFLSIPQNEDMLRRNLCFKEFLRFCRERGSLLIWNIK